MLTLPPIRWTPAAYAGAPKNECVSFWYTSDYDTQREAVARWEKAAAEATDRDAALRDRKVAQQRLEHASSVGDEDGVRRFQSDIDRAVNRYGGTEEASDEASYHDIAGILGTMLHSADVGGQRVPFPTDPGQRLKFLRALPRTIVLELLLALLRGEYDRDFRGKS